MKDPLRITLLGAALLGWALLLWLGSHESETPTVLGRYSQGYALLLATVLVVVLALTAASFSPLYELVRNQVRNGFLLALTVVLSILVAELAVRLIDPIGISYYSEARRYHLDKVADPDTYYRHRHDIDEVYQDVEVGTNEIGLRNDPISEKLPDELRILVLGDSVAFGWGVDAADTFSQQIQQTLARHRANGVTVINSGVGSYNTDNQRGFFARHGAALDPDLVALLFVGNDLEPTPGSAFDPHTELAFEGKSPVQVLQVMLSHSWMYWLIRHVSTYSRDVAQVAADQALNLAIHPGWQQSSQALLEIKAQCDVQGIPFVVFVYRTLPGEPLDSVVVAANILGRDSDFHTIDVLPWFEGVPVREITNSIVDSHPNKAGHALIARGMVKSFQTLDLISADSVPLISD